MVDRLALKQLYVDKLRDLQSAENQLVKVLPKLAKRGHLMDRLRSYGEPHRSPRVSIQLPERHDVMIGASTTNIREILAKLFESIQEGRRAEQAHEPDERLLPGRLLRKMLGKFAGYGLFHAELQDAPYLTPSELR